MKKLLSVIACLVLTLALCACGTKEAEYKLGMGVVVSLDSSKTGLAQVDATVATVVTDANGKIVACRIDAAQNKSEIADGAATVNTTFKSKMELGDDYGMAGKIDADGNGIMKEWYEQVHAFEEYVVGKTGAEVAAMETAANSIGYQMTTDPELLAAGCSMQITDFIAAVKKACDDEQGFTFKSTGEFALGLAVTSFDDGTTAATAEADGQALMYTDFAASVVINEKIAASINDAIQPKISYNADGEITKKTYQATKRELKEGYNMSTYGANMDPNNDGKVLEWYLQSEAFSKHVVGKTGAEVAAMETATNSIGYQMTTDPDLLAAGCTIQITAIKAVVAKSVENAK